MMRRLAAAIALVAALAATASPHVEAIPTQCTLYAGVSRTHVACWQGTGWVRARQGCHSATGGHVFTQRGPWKPLREWSRTAACVSKVIPWRGWQLAN